MLGVWALVPTVPAASLLIAIIILDAAVLLVQLKLAHRAIRADGASLQSYVLGLLSLVAVAMVGTTSLNRIADRALLPDLSVMSSAAHTVVDGVAVISGDITFDTFNSLQKTLAANDDLHTLSLNSGGGRIAAARGVARLVREKRLMTHVDSLCASACILVLAAGQSRTASLDARIGFHGYRLLSEVVTLNVAEEEARDRAQLRSYGISETFLNRAFAVPFEDMWFPTQKLLREVGVLTD